MVWQPSLWSPNRPTNDSRSRDRRTACLLSAVDLGTLGKAAVSLKISQPALSKRLRALEAAAGTKLLERSRRGVVPTAAGRRLYPEARRLLHQADVVESAARIRAE